MWKCPKCGREFINAEQNHFCAKPNSIDEYIASQREEVHPINPINPITKEKKSRSLTQWPALTF